MMARLMYERLNTRVTETCGTPITIAQTKHFSSLQSNEPKSNAISVRITTSYSQNPVD